MRLLHVVECVASDLEYIGTHPLVIASDSSLRKTLKVILKVMKHVGLIETLNTTPYVLMNWSLRFSKKLLTVNYCFVQFQDSSACLVYSHIS